MASTLHSLLYKLGFDVTDLSRGAATARTALDSVGASARNLATAGAPAASVLLSIGQAGNIAAAGTRPLVAGLRSAEGAIAAVSSSTGPLVAGMSGAEGAVVAVAASTGPLIAGMSGAEGAMAATTSATGPLVAGLRTANGAMAAVGASSGTLIRGIQGVNGPISALSSNMGPLVNRLGQVAGGAGGAVPPLNSVGAGATFAAGGLNRIPPAAAAANNSLRQTEMQSQATATAAGFMQRTLSMAFAFSGGVAITNLFAFVSNAVAGFNSRLEQAHIAFTTLLGDSGAADAFISKMERFAAVTPFDFDSLRDGVQRLIAMGFAADQALPTLTAIGDAVSGLGGGKDILDRVILALGQMRAAGKVNAQDMRQLTEAGIPAWRMLADAIGQTEAQTMKMAKAGRISADEAIPALLGGMEAKFGGLMERQQRTAQGAFSTIRDMALQTISGAVMPLFTAVSEGMIAVSDFLVNGGGRYVAPVIQAIGVALAVALIPRLYGAAVAASALSVSMFGLALPLLPLMVAVATLGTMWQENIGGMRDTLGPLVGSVVNAFLAAAGAVGTFTNQIGGLGIVVGVLAALITGRLVASLVMVGVEALASAARLIIIAAALNGVNSASTLATVSLGGLRNGIMLLGGALGGTAGLVTLFATALILIFTQSKQITQGLRVVEDAVLGFVQGIGESMSLLPGPFGDAGRSIVEGLRNVRSGIYAEMRKTQAELDAVAGPAAGSAGKNAGDEFSGQFGDSLNSGALEDSTQSAVDRFGATLEGVIRAAREEGGDSMLEMAKAIREKQQQPLDALKDLHEMMKDPFSKMSEIAQQYAILTSSELARGLRSNDPAIHAQALAIQKLVTDRLDALTNGAYSAGQNAGINLAGGLTSGQVLSALQNSLRVIALPIAGVFDKVLGGVTGGNVFTNAVNQGIAVLGTMSTKASNAANVWNTQYKPSAEAVANAQHKVNDELAKTDQNSQALGELNKAFSDIRQAAEEYFSKVHEKTLQAIDDARRQKNAILDAKAALIQRPVDAAQSALDFQRRKIEEFRLREAITTATDPKERRDAILALQDFLAQAHIDDMQAQVDRQKEVIDAQKKHNDDIANVQRDAENERYERQKRDFERELELLQEYLSKHPGEWQKVQGKILALLHGYGFSYKKAGQLLGNSFTEGLRDSLRDAQKALQQLQASTLLPAQPILPGAGMGGPGGVTGGFWGGSLGSGYDGGGGGIHYARQGGEWKVLADNLHFILHKDEMVAPAEVGALLRELGSSGVGSTRSSGSLGASSAGGGGGFGGYGTLVVKVGDETLAELSDHALGKSDRAHSVNTVLPGPGSSAR